MRRLSSLGAALLLLAAPAGAAPIAHRAVLGNGATLLVAERNAIPIVSVSAYLRAGSAFDPPDAPGLASLTADLLTRGTARRSGPELDRAIEFVGGSLEAGAGKDGVTISLAVLKKDLALGLDLLAEVLREPAFPEDELRRRVAEVQAALKRSEANPEAVAGRDLAQVLYPGHPYACPTPGTVESVGKLTREQVARFHREHYRPDAAVIAVVGDVTRDGIRRELEQRLTGWAPPAAPPAAIPSAIAALPPAVARTLTRDLTQATVYLGRPAIRQDHPDYFPLAVANYILGGGSASRLYTRVREDRGLAYSIYSSLSPARYGASFVVGLQTRNDGVDEAVRLAKEEMRRMGREEVAAAELELARAYLVGSFPLRMDTSGKVARLLIAVEEHGLGLDYPDRYRERIGRVTAADVQRVSARYLDPAQFSVITVRGKAP
ncbi:MAG: insulinase family protein [Candidatus Rokubacteria bacterium]|nr:insulinase family protein [Candidatus Rokubacteria bacterium]